MSLLKESINRSSRRERKSKKQSVKAKIPLLMLASLFVMVSTPIKAKTPDSSIDKPAVLKLATDSAFLLQPVGSPTVIILGESLDQREKRLKEEAQKEKALAEARRRETVAREHRVYSDPSNFNAIYDAAGKNFGIDPFILKAVHTVETGASGSTMRQSYMGATGPMQFLPSTFKRHGVDGNGDGIKDISNVEDSIHSAAAYLAACGAPNNMKKALWGYNRSESYYNKVMRIARSFGYN